MGFIIYIVRNISFAVFWVPKFELLFQWYWWNVVLKASRKWEKKNHWMVIHIYMNLLCTTIIQKFYEIWRDCTCGHDGWVGYLMLAVLYSIKWQIREFNQSFCLCRWQIDCDIMGILMWLRRVFDFYSIAHVSWVFL